MHSPSPLRIAAVLAVLASPPVAARQIMIPFASGGITAAATADPDEPRRPKARCPALVRLWKRLTTAPAAFLKMVHLRRSARSVELERQEQELAAPLDLQHDRRVSLQPVERGPQSID
jgi:hypothetical protein